MTNQIQSISLDKLIPHPANPNKMSNATFAKLIRNIERTGRYEPLIVRQVSASPCPENQRPSVFQIINGHHRALALKQLGKKQADCVVWDIDDDEANILLATLNRLCGQDALDKKLALLKRLSERVKTAELAKLLPQTKKQIQRLTSMLDTRQCPSVPAVSANPCSLVFFVSDEQQQVIETALNYAESMRNRRQTKAARRASALSAVCQYYLDHSQEG